MKIEKINTKLIKPHTPTPPNLKYYNISFADKCQKPIHLSVVLFYQRKPADGTRLEESLAKVLVQFYPLAGRYIKSDHLVDCSDQGVEFVEAEALEVELIDLLSKAVIDKLNPLLPDQYFKTDEEAIDPLLSIQATRFPSGGLTVAISVSHRVFDVASLGIFISAWSNAANPDKTIELIAPSFELPSLLPYKDHDLGVNSNRPRNDAKIVGKRISFSKEALTSLRSKICLNSDRKKISGVRVVCAIIAKTLIGLDRTKHGVDRDLVVFQAVNMRERTIPPQPKHSCGNFSFGIQELVDLIGDAVRKSITDHAEIVSPIRDGQDILIKNLDQVVKELKDSEVNVMSFTDWSRFGFYETDFGWGKPVGTSTGPMPTRSNCTVLMSNKEGDGIEAWVNLTQDDMAYFEQDENIKLFTT